LDSKEVARILTYDPDIINIAKKTYQPKEEDNWSDDYKAIFREQVKKGTAEGFGIIPNQIIRDKITELILSQSDKNRKNAEEKNKRKAKIFEVAKQTEKKQLLDKWTEPCNSPEEECNLDICYKYALPNGEIEIVRNHTW